MQRTRARTVPLVLALFALPFMGCGDSGGGTDTSPAPTTGAPPATSNATEGDSNSAPDETSGAPDTSDGTTDDSGAGKIDCSTLQANGGNEVGDVPNNVELLDAQGKKVSLHDYCNDILYVLAGAAF